MMTFSLQKLEVAEMTLLCMDCTKDQAVDKEISSESSTEDKQKNTEDANESETKASASSEPSSSQPGFPILGGFEKKVVQKVVNRTLKSSLLGYVCTMYLLDL